MKEWEEYAIKSINCSKNGNHDEAITYCKKAVSLCDDDSEFGNLYYNLGIEFAFSNDIQNAIASLKIASDLGCEDALEFLKDRGINYTPKKPSSSSAPNSGGSSAMPPPRPAAQPAMPPPRPAAQQQSSSSAYPPVSSLPQNFTGIAEKHIFPNGEIYKGEWNYGNPCGNGEMIYKDGTVYEGEFFDGRPNGIGRIKYKDGRVYEGKVFNYRPDGKGKMTYPNGKVEEGKWKDGNFKGKGLFG